MACNTYDESQLGAALGSFVGSVFAGRVTFSDGPAML